jgi:hypothetical protein
MNYAERTTDGGSSHVMVGSVTQFSPSLKRNNVKPFCFAMQLISPAMSYKEKTSLLCFSFSLLLVLLSALNSWK